MAKVVHDFEARPPGFSGLYDWDSWINGQAWELIRGVDFQTSARKMQTMFLREAKRRGFQGKTRKIDDDTLWIQATKDTKPETV